MSQRLFCAGVLLMMISGSCFAESLCPPRPEVNGPVRDQLQSLAELRLLPATYRDVNLEPDPERRGCYFETETAPVGTKVLFEVKPSKISPASPAKSLHGELMANLSQIQLTFYQTTHSLSQTVRPPPHRSLDLKYSFHAMRGSYRLVRYTGQLGATTIAVTLHQRLTREMLSEATRDILFPGSTAFLQVETAVAADSSPAAAVGRQSR